MFVVRLKLLQLARTVFTASVVGAALMGLDAAAQQGWPAKPVHLFVGYPAGGQTDIMGRIIAESLAKELGQPVVVENKAGASGLIAAEYVAHAPADGYTLMVTTDAIQSRAPAVYKKVPYDPVNAFSMVRKVAKQKAVMVVNSESQWTDVKGFLAYAKANPGKINYGATYATSSQFGGALFSLLNGVEMVAINYPGGAKPITDLLGKTVDVGFFVESTVVQHVQSGKLRALAVASNERSTLFPGLPTMREAGVAPMEVSPWFGVVAPAKTPEAIVTKVATALDRAITTPEMKQRLAAVGAIPIESSTPESFTADIRSEMEYWRKFVADSKFPLMD